MTKTVRLDGGQEVYTYEQALQDSTAYFEGDELPARVFVDKYALRNDKEELLENTPDKMHWRIATEIVRIEKKKFKTPLTREDVYAYLKDFRYIIPQGSPMFGIGNPFQIVSLSNCYVIPSPRDSYGGIHRYDEHLTQISKRRGGVGGDISTLRPAGARTQNAARTSTGVVSFMSRFSNSIREVGQNGRRGAEMLTISIKHPDSVIPWDDEKDGKEFTTHIFDAENGWDFDISSRYYNPKKLDFATVKYDRSKVTGANVSIRITDEFMQAVKNKASFTQCFPVDDPKSHIMQSVDAQKVWDKIIHSAWQTAEPGVLFWDTVLRESVSDCYANDGFQTISTNPCSEIPLPAYDSCRLLLLNLLGYIVNPFTTKAYFDFPLFFEHVKVAQRIMDDIIDLEEENILLIIKKIKSDAEEADVKRVELSLWENILDICRRGRRTGTGVTGVGDTIAALGYAYGSPKSIEVIENIYKVLKFAAYESSIDMAEEIGPFPIWDADKEKSNPFLCRFADESVVISDGIQVDGKNLLARMQKVGRRNIAILTTAPAGSSSIVAKAFQHFGISSGIEPQFDIAPYIRKKKGNPGDVNFRSDEVDQNGDHWMHFGVFPASVRDWMAITGKTDYKESPWFDHCAKNLDWKARVKIQAAAQRHVDHAISSTVNLPNNVTVDKVKEIYEAAWEMGCKGITIYRDGSRSGVLISKGTNGERVKKADAPKRPKDLPAEVYHTTVKGKKYFVAVGKLLGDPYEVFAGANTKEVKEINKGVIRKNKRGHYSFLENGEVVVDNLSSFSSDDEEALNRMLSTALRHGTDIGFVVHQLEKVRGDMQSMAKSISRILKKYVPNGTKLWGEVCPDCKQEGTLERQEGCYTCKACGMTGCN